MNTNMKVLEDLHNLVEEGCTCFIAPGKDYGYIITRCNNIMYFEYSEISGYRLAIEYQPSRENGCGCSENSSQIALDYPNLVAAENECYNYAIQLDAKFYESPHKWMEDRIKHNAPKLQCVM